MDIQTVLSVLLHMQQFRTRDHWTRQQLEAHQADALRDLREYAYTHAPFYSLSFFSTLLSDTAFVATVIELALMARAPTSGLSRIPKG